MHQNDTRKTPLIRSEIVKNEKQLLFSQGMLLIFLAAGVLGLSAVWTVAIIATFHEFLLGFWIFLLAIALSLWGFFAYVAYIAVKTNLSLLCLLTGKYTIEIDRVQCVELRSEKNRTYYRSMIGKMNKSDYITWQYVHFEKYGEIKTEPEQQALQDAQYYVLVALTKTPRVLHFYACDQYELIN